MDLYKSNCYREDLREAAAAVDLSVLRGCSVLITGATGTIGSFAVDTLMQYNLDTGAGIRIYAVGRDIDRLKSRFDGINDGFIEYAVYDLEKPVEFEFSVDYIIHAAGNAYPALFSRDPVGTVLNTINGTAALLAYAERVHAKRFLYVSTGEVYGQGDGTIEAYPETYSGYVDPVNPRSCYPASKRAAENLCASYTKQYGLETVIVRPSHTYGPGITDGDDRANAQFLRNAAAGRDIVLNSPGKQLRSYCYIADCIAILLTALVKGESGQVYNSANPDARLTISELAQLIAKTAGTECRFADPTAADLAKRSIISCQVLDTGKIEALGWKGRFPAERGVEHCLRVMREAQN